MQQECPHEARLGRVFTDEGEVVCPCGTVLEERLVDEEPPPTKYVLSLYHQVEKGGDPADAKAVAPRIHIRHSHSSEFSNICSRLRLPLYVQHAAWQIYCKLYPEISHSRAKCALHALFKTCRWLVIVNEDKIRDAIRAEMNVKNVPNTFHTMYNLQEESQEIGIKCDSPGPTDHYLKRAMANVLPTITDPEDYDRFKTTATRKFMSLKGSPRERARKAINEAFVEMGLD